MKTIKIDLYDYKNIPLDIAAKVIGKGKDFIRFGLQQQRLPIGSAVKGIKNYDYHVSPYLLEKYIGSRYAEIQVEENEE